MKKTGVTIAGLIMLALAACSDRIEPGTASVERPTVSGVPTLTVALDKAALFHEATATVQAEVESAISSRIMGQVRSVFVKEGDRVKAGQLLISIDSEDITNKVAAAEAAYREAVQALSAAEQNRALTETTYNRFKNLYAEKALSLQELDKIETQKNVAAIEYERIREMVRRAEAGLAEAKVFSGYKEIVAPIGGIVTGKFIDPGTMAMPGMPLLTIEETSGYRLEAQIDESLAGQIRPGLNVEVEISALNAKLTGTVSETVPAVDPRTRTFKVFIGLPSEAKLHSGLYARARIPVGEKELIMVPATSVARRGQLTGVYVVDANRVITYRLVRLGKEYGNNIEVLSGLKPGEVIISDNVSKVTDGAILQVEK